MPREEKNPNNQESKMFLDLVFCFPQMALFRLSKESCSTAKRNGFFLVKNKYHNLVMAM